MTKILASGCSRTVQGAAVIIPNLRSLRTSWALKPPRARHSDVRNTAEMRVGAFMGVMVKEDVSDFHKMQPVHKTELSKSATRC